MGTDCVCVKVTDLKHVLAAAGLVFLTRPSNISLHSQLRANLDKLRVTSARLSLSLSLCVSLALSSGRFHTSMSLIEGHDGPRCFYWQNKQPIHMASVCVRTEFYPSFTRSFSPLSFFQAAALSHSTFSS